MISESKSPLKFDRSTRGLVKVEVTGSGNNMEAMLGRERDSFL